MKEKKGNPGKRNKTNIMILLIMLVIAAAWVIATGTAPYFTPTPPPSIICYQNSTCFYDFNATDDESDPYRFSIDEPPYMSGKIDSITGIVNFTPTNDEVGTYSGTWVIVKETDTSNGSNHIMTWYILNINDAPNITSYHPENLTNITLKEGTWTDLNITAEDVDIQYGDQLNYTWYINGTINKTLLNYTDNVANYTPDYFSAGTWNITVNVSDNTSAWVMINWTVNVTNENRAPINNVTIPNVTMIEDTGNYSVFNLSDYFYDLDLDDYPLSFNVTGNNNITVIINDTDPYNVSFMPDQNFFGINLLYFICDDSYNTTSTNYTIVVNVTGVNDPPIINQVDNRTAYAETLFQLQIEASDPDHDPITCYDNTTLFNINPSTCFISDTFLVSEIGNYSIEINASDGVTNTSMVFNLSVINNTAPVIGGTPLPDIYTQEGNISFRADFNATDVDPLDLLYFWSTTNKTPNPAKVNITTTNSSPINATGYFAFTPDQNDVGDWRVTVFVNDSKGAVDFETFTLHILNVEHNPILDFIPNQRMKVNKTFTLYIFAQDEDGDIGSYGENTSMFNITTYNYVFNATGLINFTPNNSDIGQHWVNITINDSSGRYDWQLVQFNVTYNTPPVMDIILNQTALEDHLFQLQVNATDPDPQDILVFSDNSTLFNISSSGLISFTPNVSQTGDYVINITVTDGESNASTLMNLTIGEYNDYPYWDPSLNEYYTNTSRYLNTTIWNSTWLLNYTTNMTVWNRSIYEKNLTLIYMDAYDEESPTLTFSVSYVNFTNASNDTVTTGITLINLTSYDGNTALANMTPNNSQVGKYYVNFSIDDTTGRINNTMIFLEVFNINDAPIITNYSPNVTYYQNMTEDSSMRFNVTAIDIDYGDSIRYQWLLNGTNISGANTSSLTYRTDYFSAGMRNITVSMTDNNNATTILNWTVNVSNVNRIGWFGQLKDYNYTQFSQGNPGSNLTILPGDDGVILKLNGTGYKRYGIFESRVLDTRETNVNRDELVASKFTTINWTGNTTPPENTSFNIYFNIRSEDPAILASLACPTPLISNYTNTTYNISNSDIVSERRRCIQYKFYIGTNDTNKTPSISNVTIGYAIADRQQEQNTNQTWIALDTYFYDPDTDDNVTFNASSGNNTPVQNVNVIINDAPPHKVTLNTINSTVGQATVQFHMFDGYNTTDSNIITINISEVESYPEVIIVPIGGGGGSVSNPVPYEVPKYVSTPVSFRLITPQAVTTYVNQSMQIPINLFNSNFTMENIRLKATSPNQDVVIRLSKDFIPRMEPNQKEFVTVYVDSFKTYGTYEILVEATAEATSVAEDGKETMTEFTEKAKIFINSLLKASGNESQVNTKLAFAEDLLSTNPECLELNEFLKKTQQMLTENKLSEAEKMLDQVIESCKYLIAPKEMLPDIEEPSKVYGMPTESVFILGTVALITLITTIALIIGWSHMRAKRKELTRKKEE